MKIRSWCLGEFLLAMIIMSFHRSSSCPLVSSLARSLARSLCKYDFPVLHTCALTH